MFHLLSVMINNCIAGHSANPIVNQSSQQRASQLNEFIKQSSQVFLLKSAVVRHLPRKWKIALQKKSIIYSYTRVFTLRSAILSLFLYSSFFPFHTYSITMFFLCSLTYNPKSFVSDRCLFPPCFPLFSSLLCCPKFLRKGEKTQIIIILIPTLSV